MTVTYLGSRSVAGVNLALATSLPALNAYVASLLAARSDLQARIETYASLSVTLADPASIAAQLAAALGTLAGTLTSIAAGALPTVSAASAGAAADLAALGVTISGVRAIVDTLTAAASAGGIHGFAVDSTAGTVGSELALLVSSGLPGGGGPAARVQGVAFLTEDPAAHAALSTVLRTS